MLNEIDIVRDISRRFAQAQIDYMLTGSIALNYYTQPRMTRDIDVVVKITRNDVNTIIGLFSPDYYVDDHAVHSAIANESLFNLIHQESIIKVDCIVRKSSEYRRVEFERKQRVKIQDFETWIVSKEDLIISKLYWAKDSHSELQRRDVKSLIDTGCDAPYVDKWTKILGLHDLLQECSQ